VKGIAGAAGQQAISRKLNPKGEAKGLGGLLRRKP